MKLSTSTFLLLPFSLTSLTFAATSKRGISMLGDDHRSDWSLLTSSGSPLSWYWNWSPWPAAPSLVSTLQFIPQIHGIDNIEANIAQALTLPENVTHLFTFNEPDGTTGSGGSSISPKDAAEAYIKHILPIRKGSGGRFLVSHPATTGSPNGLEWLRDFNASCYKQAPKTGCPSDFIAAHWYGAYDGLTGWIGDLDTYYNTNTSRATPLKIWITEVAIPQVDEKATLQMMNDTLPWLEGKDVVEKYAWFGMFRTDESNAWTGKDVAMFGKDGSLTELGALYMNGVEVNGTKSTGHGEEIFTEGQKGEAKDEAGDGKGKGSGSGSGAAIVSMSSGWLWTGFGLACMFAWAI